MWTINGNVFFVQDFPESTKQIVARLNPLGGGTVHQFFGWDDPVVRIGGLIIGDTAKDAIKLLTHSTSSVSLVAPWGTVGNFFVGGLETQRIICLSQTVYPAAGCDAPVYKFTMELYQDV